MDWNALVCEIVQVPHRAPSTKPSDVTTVDIIGAFHAFCAQASDVDRAALAPALEKLELFSSTWLPAYGCVVFASPAGYNALSHVVLVHTDFWQSNLSCRSFGETSFILPSSSTVRDLGTIPTDAVHAFEAKLGELLQEDAKRHSNPRIAPSGEHRKTPYLVEFLAHRALVTGGDASAQGKPQPPALVTDDEATAQGVSGDIHIGTQPPATAYPLVEAALQYFLASRRTFCRLRAHFLLWLANQFKAKAQMDSINNAMNLVDAIALAAMDIDDHGESVDAITTRVQSIRAKIDATYSQARVAKDRRMQMIPIELNEATSPVLTSDALEPKVWPTQPLTAQERQALALANSGALPTFPQHGAVTRASFEQLLAWINSHPRLTAGQDQEACLLVFSEIHALMWSCAKHLSATESPLDLSVDDVSAVDALMTAYSTMMTAWLASTHGEQQMMVKLRSYEVVVTWVAYYLVHQHCARAFPLVQEYASPLAWTDLRCLVLEDKRAIDAARLVAGYIRRINMVSDLKLFSLAETTGSVQFARRFAEQCPEMELRLAHEKKAVAAEMDKYMRKVRNKQTRVAALRAELPMLQSTLDQARLKHEDAKREQISIRDKDERERGRHGEKSPLLRAAERATHNAYNNMNEAERTLIATNAEIVRVLVPPPFVVCPLPESDDRARSVLFFFMIPSTLNILARLSAASQYTLVPRPPGEVIQNTDVTAPSTSWAKHYSAKMFQQPGCHPPSQCHWTIFPEGFGIPLAVGPTSVDGITQARPSFWFPNKFELGMQWSTGLNPYLVTPLQMEAFFTDQLQERQLQWIMEFPASAAEGDSSRGNLPYANLFMQPHGLSKIEYLTLGSLRAFPNQQLRKLVQALHASTLPLSHPLVLRAICQTIYHIGDLSDTDSGTESVDLLWKRDLDREWLEKWHDGLSIQIDLLRDTIRDYKAFVAAVVMASYLSQFYPPARELARELANIAKKWVDITRAERLDGRSSESHRLELRAKECLMYGYGILAMSFVGDLTTEDARKLVEFVVMFRYGLLFGDGSSIQNEVAWVQVQVANVMASRINIVYFDPAKDCWMSLGRATRSSVPLHDSPIKERDSFVLFDDARSRGTDMKMHAATVAVLTLGPKLTKDKLMQGAGRLRLLGKDQRVVVAVPPEIQQALPALTMPAILKWVIKNTAASIESGLTAWSQQGLAFCKSKQVGVQSVVEEHWALEDMYKSPLNVLSLSLMVRTQVDADHGGCNMAARIADHCATFAAEVGVITTSFGEECERELQVEEEEEQEQEAERVVKTAAVESSWAYQSMLTAKSARGVSTSVLALPEAVKNSWDSTNLSAVAWPDNVYTTASFLETIETKTTIEFTRLADMVVVFPNRDVLLLSDKEADAVLEIMWQQSRAGGSKPTSLRGVLMALGKGLACMANASMLRFAHRSTPSLVKAKQRKLSIRNEVVLALFNGETKFDQAKDKALSQLLAQPRARRAIQDLIVARGESRNWAESDLEKWSTCYG